MYRCSSDCSDQHFFISCIGVGPCMKWALAVYSYMEDQSKLGVALASLHVHKMGICKWQ